MTQQLADKHQKIRDILNGVDRSYSNLGYTWQEQLEQKINLSNDYLKADNIFNNLLQQVGDDSLAERIREAAAAKECAFTYFYHKHELLEGLQIMLTIKKIPGNERNLQPPS